ncbi:MAG: ATP synthase F1 subunit delta [Flavipsychrobacter sp.]|nr:ATP synthase F1 subunit delta [Flavipsychrobacter sp.]
MQNPRLASRYAKSLLDLAVEQNKLDATLTDMKLLEAICKQNRDFAAMLRSPIIKADKKQAILKAVLDGKLSDLANAFINLLVSKGRESNLQEMAGEFVAQYNKMKDIRTVKLTTAAPVSDVVKEAIKAKVAKSLNSASVEMKTAVNPDLIGGFVLEVEDKMFDASIRRDLNDIKSQFLDNIYVSKILAN